MNKQNRPTWHEYFFSVAYNIARRSSCGDAHRGAVFVSKDHDILATGYNGSPRGLPHCTDDGCDVDEKGSCQGTIHAEVNGIIQAARNGVSLKGSDVYINAFPCFHCFKALVNVGVSVIYYGRKHKPKKHFARYEKIERLARLVSIPLISKTQALVIAKETI